jgi:hypothetical protein
MSSTYQLLFRINFFHTYFTNGKFTAIQLKPDQSTQNIFKNYDLILRNEANGVGVFFAEQFADERRTREQILSDQLVFTFKLNSFITNVNSFYYAKNIIMKSYFWFLTIKLFNLKIEWLKNL